MKSAKSAEKRKTQELAKCGKARTLRSRWRWSRRRNIKWFPADFPRTCRIYTSVCECLFVCLRDIISSQRIRIRICRPKATRVQIVSGSRQSEKCSALHTADFVISPPSRYTHLRMPLDGEFEAQFSHYQLSNKKSISLNSIYFKCHVFHFHWRCFSKISMVFCSQNVVKNYKYFSAYF